MRKRTAVVSVFFIAAVSVFSQVRLPGLVSDGMVLQRDADVRIWGWASGGEEVSLQFLNSTYQMTAGKDGTWEVILSNLKAGGPYVMQIDADNSITIHDIFVGDVWVCSGQSNMQMALGWLGHVYQDEIDTAQNPMIRHYSVPMGTCFNGQEKDFRSGKWQPATSENVRNFTAVGYFFAKKLFETYHVPIGLINASYGGSCAEAWISETSIQAFPKYKEEAERAKNPGYIEKINQQDDERIGNWNRQLRQNDKGFQNPERNWFDPGLDDSDWEATQVPGYWADTNLGAVNGVVWYRKEFHIPSEMAGKPALLKLGRIVDCDTVFINGRFIGSFGSQYAQRHYQIPEEVLREGKNIIVVRIINTIRHGGFVPGKRYSLSSGDHQINLEGEWKFRLGASADLLKDRLFTAKIPTGLFNSMIAPMLNYRIKGVLWYQGESNTSRAFEHYDLFKLLIKDWRQQWRQGSFPFLFVQLPNFVEVNIETTQYDWAIFRESQLKALSIPNTGMAVTIDIGEWNDIHPVNKKDVGNRLALAAMKVAYDEKNIVCSGPVYESMKIEGDQIILTFSHTGSGLITESGGPLKCFEICGKDNEYFPASAKIENNCIIVRSPNVPAPVCVRYAWANNPEDPNLYNREGLPASPFRTSDLY